MPDGGFIVTVTLSPLSLSVTFTDVTYVPFPWLHLIFTTPGLIMVGLCATDKEHD